jgi:alkylation response protein AidB-like acyl-CoA dehydrogenase
VTTVEFALDDDQVTLQSVLREFFDDRVPESAVRAQLEDPTAFDRQLWKRMSPEQYGGAGFTFFELGLVLEEMGRALVVSPFLASCVMATRLLLAIDDEDVRVRLLPGIASGDVIATVALAEDTGSWRPADVTTTASLEADGWRVDGHKAFVVDGAVADLLLVVARTPEGLGLFEVAANTDGVRRTPLATMDQTRKLARLEFDGAAATLLARGADAEHAVEEMLDHTRIALAADALGGTGRVLDMSVAYAKTREQFGRTIGSFQAIKHKCASMLVELESSRAAVYYALWAAATGQPDRPVVAPLVKAHCVDVYLAATGENIQIHGGIGFTWEHAAHLYLKRAKSSQVLLGGSDFHRQLLADRINI